jgi:hypothetical protein
LTSPIVAAFDPAGDNVPLLADLHDAFAAVGCPQNAELILRRMSFAFHGLGLLYWPRLTPKAAQKFGVTSLPNAVSL